MRSFLSKIILFLLPIGFLFAFSYLVFLRSGEFASIAHLVALQSGATQHLYGTAYTDFNDELKRELAGKKHAEVLALGTSRIEEFRSAFFRSPELFYNASLGVHAPEEFLPFLESLPASSTPRVVIISLDQYFFNPGAKKQQDFKAIKERETSWDIFVNGGWKFPYRDLLLGKCTLSALLVDSSNIGINARCHANGFRNDGSYQYGSFLSRASERAANRREQAEVTESIGPDYAWEFGIAIDQKALGTFGSFLKACKQKGIAVIGFLPPYAISMHERIAVVAGPAYVQTTLQLPVKLQNLFEENGASFFDFSDPRSFGSSDEELINEGHASEKGALRMLIGMTKKTGDLVEYVDVSNLESILRQSKSDYEVF